VLNHLGCLLGNLLGSQLVFLLPNRLESQLLSHRGSLSLFQVRNLPVFLLANLLDSPRGNPQDNHPGNLWLYQVINLPESLRANLPFSHCCSHRANLRVVLVGNPRSSLFALHRSSRQGSLSLCLVRSQRVSPLSSLRANQAFNHLPNLRANRLTPQVANPPVCPAHNLRYSQSWYLQHNQHYSQADNPVGSRRRYPRDNHLSSLPVTQVSNQAYCLQLPLRRSQPCNQLFILKSFPLFNQRHILRNCLLFSHGRCLPRCQVLNHPYVHHASL
jgi:hypothetical protein